MWDLQLCVHTWCQSWGKEKETPPLSRQINSKCPLGVEGVTGMAAAKRMCVFVCVGVCVWEASTVKKAIFAVDTIYFRLHGLERWKQKARLRERLCKRCSSALYVPKERTNVLWPTSEEMRNLHHIYSDMTGLVVIITWEHLALFSLNRSSGNQEPFQRTVEAILQLDAISVSPLIIR